MFKCLACPLDLDPFKTVLHRAFFELLMVLKRLPSDKDSLTSVYTVADKLGWVTAPSEIHDLAKMLLSFYKKMGRSYARDTPALRMIAVAMICKAGHGCYGQKQFKEALDFFSGLRTCFSEGYVESRQAMLFEGLCHLKLDNEEEGVRALTQYFKGDYSHKKVNLMTPTFSSEINILVQQEYRITVFDHYEKKSVLYKKISTSDYVDYRLSRVIAVGGVVKDSCENDWVLRHRGALYDRCVSLILDPTVLDHKKAVATYKKWFSVSDYSGKPADYVMSCGHVISQADDVATTLCIPTGRLTTFCPCCRKEGAFKELSFNGEI